jgi:ATP-binding cassette, subfamily C, bacterial LapB
MSESELTRLTPIAGSPQSGPVRGLKTSEARYVVSDASITNFHDKLRHTLWQHGEGDTSLAKCLCTLLLALDPTMEIARVIESLPRRGENVDTLDIINALANVGYDSKPARLRPRDIDLRLLPCLFVLGDVLGPKPAASFVFLERNDQSVDGQIDVFDGQKGSIRRISEDDPLMDTFGTAYFCQKFEADAIEPLSPNPRFSEPRWFRRTLSRFSSTFWWLLMLGVVLNTVALATPISVMLIYDRVIAPQTLGPLPMLLVGLAGAIFIEWRLRSLRTDALAWLTARLDYVIGASIFERLLLLAPSFVERAAVAAQVARIKTFESVRDFFSGPVFLAVLELPTVFIAALAIAYLAGNLVFVPIAVAVIYGLLFASVRHFVKGAIREAAKHSSVTQQFTIETFEKLEDLRAQGLQAAWARKYKQLSGREQVALSKLYFLGSIGETLGHGLSVIAALATLTIGVQMIWSGAITVGVLIASMIMVWRILMPFYSLCQMIPRFEQTRHSIAQINELMELEPETRAEVASARLAKVEGAVSFRNVALRYARDAGPVFFGLNASIRPGEVVAIRGPSGSGKSSILKLVQSLYAPQTGAIFMDGFDVRQLMVRDVRRLVAYLPQQPHLLNGTIADNLRIVRPLADDQELWNALRRAGASRQVAALPDSINTQTETSSAIASDPSLAHRIAMARALLQKSAILLLDEIPNSLMASGLGETIGDVIGEARGRQTLFFVTHRTDHARLADKIITLRPGGIPVIENVHELLEQSA